ncbi:pentapeptide repeat-containing protein [Lignipirellula cremea]|uniref:Pentapeptide repeats (8 copies) n=1 Tax=Lignipirellula cremea TaxID=2528010 RepID=A0A518DV02_9BACT|nr:pentapeptide repeat-containing protein [Lignipirellula cremea]QDU95663.1 Pentapeptide repeats (8 copies) [Lignipirellula cremea]
MKASEIKMLRDRWSDPKTCSNAIAFIHGKGDAPFTRTAEQNEDLRGLPVSAMLREASLEYVDMSAATLEGFGQFIECSLRQCKLVKGSFTTNLGNAFYTCDFSTATLAGAMVRGSFTECDFTKSNLTGCMGVQCRFVRCRFHQTNFRKATLIQCLFENCSFEQCKFGNGSLASSRFIDSKIAPETLGNTLMENAVFE